jgi:hypothetical protein
LHLDVCQYHEYHSTQRLRTLTKHMLDDIIAILILN